MFKRRLSVAVASLAISILASSSVFAQGTIPGIGWWSGTQIQNVHDSDVTIDMRLYDKDSNAECNANQAITPGSSTTLTPGSFDQCAGFQGSAVISSDGPVKAIVNITNRQSGDLGDPAGLAAGQYQGLDSGQVADVLYFPLVKGNSFSKTTTFYIQNAGSSAVSPTATFTMRNGDTHTVSNQLANIEPNKMRVISVLDATTFNPSDNDGRVGSLTIDAGDSSARLAGAVLEHFHIESVATILQATRGFTEADFDDKVFAPVIKNSRFNRFTGLQIQNVTAGAIDITVTYTGSAGDCAGNSYTDTATGVAAGASHTFVHLAGRTTLPENCTASATVTATGNVVAIVNESFVSAFVGAGNSQRSTTFSAMPEAGATTKISVPLYKDNRFNKITGLQIQNIGSAAANITASFSCQGGATFTATSSPQSVAAGGAVLFFRPSNQADKFPGGSPFSSDNVNCGVTVTSDQNIVAIANESVTPESGFQQDNNNYEGFNLAP